MESPGSGSRSDYAEKTYKIGDLAAMFNLTVRTLRYYEELGLLKSSDREEGLHRRYPERNIIYLQRIAQLKDYGLTLAEIKDFFALAARDRSGEACRKLLLGKYRDRITEQEDIIRKASARLESLRWHASQLESVRDFFECPGKQCPACSFAQDCDMRGSSITEDTL